MSLSERMAALRRGFSAEASANVEGTSDADDTPQMAAPPRSGSVRSAPVPSTPATLPGLGGSPLPQGKWTPRNGATSGGGASQEVASDYPVMRDVTADKRAAESQQSVTAPQPPAESSSSRHSPSKRSIPQLDPAELQRELAGSFSSSNDGPAARTARAEDPNLSDNDRGESPLVLPPIEAAVPFPGNPSAARPMNVEPPQTLQQQPPTISQPSRSAAEAFGVTSESSGSLGGSSFTRSPRLNRSEPAASASGGRQGFGEALQVANGGDPTVLLSNQTPVITADIRGPKQIIVGREAVYRVRLQNEGAAVAEGIVATIRIPSWAEVVGTVTTKGSVQPSQNADSPTQLEWQLTRIEGRATETLDIQLVPREGRPLELGISWTVAPIGSRAIVEVQEPKLEIDVAGPNEVYFGKPQVFRLTLSNPGTGPADNVNIELVPPGGATETVASHPFGTLQPGETKTVEIELTARDAGKLQVKAIASAEGGLVADVSKDIFCRKPELEVDWRGPSSQYAGTTATYFFRVRNPGTAPAENVAVQVALPDGAEFASASEGQTFDAQRRNVTWRVGSLAPGDDSYMELKCVVKKPGVNQFQIAAATASGDLADEAAAETNVIALADLKLEVKDPSGAVAVGNQAIYEIHVTNRGSSAAKEVTVVALFSEGIEPDQAEGAMYTISDGRVAFRPIEELAPGRDITLRIRARAVQPGTHVFRAEVLCQDAEIKLAAEETTRFYSDEVSTEADTAAQQTSSRNAFESSTR